MARVRQAEGDPTRALELLDEAERVYVADFSPNVDRSPPEGALWLAAGELAEALGWARERRLSADDDLCYVHEYEHITLARVLLAKHESERVEGGLHDPARLLERLLEAAEAGPRTGSVIEILVVQALVHQAGRDIPAALASLERALTLAEPEGYVRLFIDEGLPMASLLRAAVKQGSPRGMPADSLPPEPRPSARTRPTGPDRAAERARTRRAPAAGNRPGRP